MTRYIVKRLLIVVASLFGLITVSFAMVSLIPGDPAVAILGEFATRDQIAAVHQQLGLDQPFLQRYADYVWQTLQGDLGTSYFTGKSVTEDLLSRVPTTLVVLVPGLIGALALGLGAGVISAYFRRRLPDRVANFCVMVLQAIPEFVTGLFLLFIFFTVLKVAPAPLGMLDSNAIVPRSVTGSVPIDAVLTGSWSTVASIAEHAILPVLTMTLFFAAPFAKTVRSELGKALASPQVEFGRACGLPPRKLFGYAMGEVRTSLLTFLVILFGAALGGAAIVENVFSWPGAGNWSLQGVLKGDIPVIQGFVLLTGTATLLAYLLLDIVVMLLDPRARR